jgi:hypothetical protein
VDWTFTAPAARSGPVALPISTVRFLNHFDHR